MLGKIGTHADNSDFRDLLSNERSSTTTLTRNILSTLKAARQRGPVVQQFEREYRRFAQVIERIDLKQKQQIVAISHKDQNPLGAELEREEAARGHAGSFVQDQLPAGEAIEFLEYRVDELAARTAQIRAVERDVAEVAEMFKDLSAMVEEQQVHIDVISDNIVTSRDKVESGMKELESAEYHQKKARKRACCCLILMLSAIAAVVLITMGVLKKF